MARKQNSSIIAGQFRQRKPERCLHAIDGASGVSGAIPLFPLTCPATPQVDRMTMLYALLRTAFDSCEANQTVVLEFRVT